MPAPEVIVTDVPAFEHAPLEVITAVVVALVVEATVMLAP
jgi:hypothetical protein